MAPRNPYLDDPEVVRRLTAHHPQLVKLTTIRFPGDPVPQEHADFNREIELGKKATGSQPMKPGLFAKYLANFSDADFQEGNVTVTEAAQATFGFTSDYLEDRIRGHLLASSTFNKDLVEDGQICVVDGDGQRIVRDDAHRIALMSKQAAADEYARRTMKVMDVQARKAKLATRRALRIDPSAEDELVAIDRGAWDTAADYGRKALGIGEQ